MPGWFLLMKKSLPKNSPDRKFFGLNTEIFAQRMIALEIFAKSFKLKRRFNGFYSELQISKLVQIWR